MKMKVFLCFLGWISCCFSGLGWADKVPSVEFSAEIIRSDASQQEPSSRGKIYVGRNGIRTEASQNQQPIWMIFRPDSKIVWTLFPEQQMYMERIGLSLERPPLPGDDNSPCRSKNFVCKNNGWQKINNRSVVHWTIDLLEPNGKNFYAQLWVDPKLNIAIRESYADGLMVEMQNIHEAPQADSLFELPQGYQKVVLPTLNKNQGKQGKPSSLK